MTRSIDRSRQRSRPHQANSEDRQDFIKTLAEACQKTNWQVHAYCLMPNHYHLVLETPEPNLVAGMAWLQEADLLVRPKNDAFKLEIAARLRRETTLSTKAIAGRVHLGSSKAANRSLHSYMRGGAVASAGQGQLGVIEPVPGCDPFAACGGGRIARCSWPEGSPICWCHHR